MPFKYDFAKLKQAILFNTQEVLPTDEDQLDKEIHLLVEQANLSGEPIRHYIGFEISGQIHVGTGIMTAIKVKKLQEAGVKCSIWLANYHTWLNGKLDGKKESIKKFNEQYFIPVFAKCFEACGCEVAQIDFWSAEDLYYGRQAQGRHFWDFMMKVAKNLTLSRVNKSVTVTGKQAGEAVEFGVLCYPVMQVADAFFMQTHLVHAGLDQRKCHVLMREVASKMDEGFDLKIGSQAIKPIAMHHPLLLSLGVGAEQTGGRMSAEVSESAKMSKSKPDSAIWVHDSREEIARKLKKAYCPMPRVGQQTPEEIATEQEWNPMLDWCKKMIYPAGKQIEIKRKAEWGGDVIYPRYDELYQDYCGGKVHPMDLKNGVTTCLATWFEPIREFVETNGEGLEFLKSVKK